MGLRTDVSDIDSRYGMQAAAHVMIGGSEVGISSGSSVAHACKRMHGSFDVPRAVSVSHVGSKRVHVRAQTSHDLLDVLAEKMREPFWRLMACTSKGVTPETLAGINANAAKMQCLFASVRADNHTRAEVLRRLQEWGLTPEEKRFFGFEG